MLFIQCPTKWGWTVWWHKTCHLSGHPFVHLSAFSERAADNSFYTCNTLHSHFQSVFLILHSPQQAPPPLPSGCRSMCLLGMTFDLIFYLWTLIVLLKTNIWSTISRAYLWKHKLGNFFHISCAHNVNGIELYTNSHFLSTCHNIFVYPSQEQDESRLWYLASYSTRGPNPLQISAEAHVPE